LRSVEQKRKPQVGIDFVLFDVETVLFCPDFPIDASGIIAGNVLPVLSKLNGVTEVPGLVQPAQKAIHNMLCPKVKPGNPFESLWMKIVREHEVNYRRSMWFLKGHATRVRFLSKLTSSLPNVPIFSIMSILRENYSIKIALEPISKRH